MKFDQVIHLLDDREFGLRIRDLVDVIDFDKVFGSWEPNLLNILLTETVSLLICRLQVLFILGGQLPLLINQEPLLSHALK